MKRRRFRHECKKKVSVILFLWVMATALHASLLVWTNLVGGNWNTAVNWTPNTVPVPGDTVFITNNGTYTVVLGTTTTVSNLNVGGASGKQTFSCGSPTFAVTGASFVNSNGVFTFSGNLAGRYFVDGELNWWGGDMQGALTVNAGGKLSVSTSSGMVVSGVVTNFGTLAWTGGTIYSPSGTGVIYNQSGALLDVQDDVNVFGFGGNIVVNNAGTLRKSGGSGVTGFVGYQATCNNSGLVQAQSGTLIIGNGSSSGAFTVNSGAALEFADDGAQTLTPSGSISGAGTVIVGGGGHAGYLTNNGSYNITGSTVMNGTYMVLNGPVLNLGATVTNNYFLAIAQDFTNHGTFTLNGAFAGSGAFTLDGTMYWQAGVIFKPFTVAAGSTVNAFGGNVANRMTNYGTINILDGAVGIVGFNGSGTLYNQQGGTIDAQGNGTIVGYPLTLNNYGTVRKSAGTGISFIADGATNNNNGTVQVLSGTLSVCGGNSSGNFDVSAGAMLNFYGYQGPGPQVLTAAANITGAGAVSVGGSSSGGALINNGTHNISGSTTVGHPPDYWYGATMVLNGPVLNLGAAVTNDGNLIIQSNVTFTGTMYLFDNTLSGSGTMTLGAPGTLYWEGGQIDKVFTVQAGATVIGSGGNGKGLNQVMNNYGTFIWTGTEGIRGGTFNNFAGALLDVQDDSPIACCSQTFNNYGTVQKSAGAGRAAFGDGMTVNNNGVIQAQSGTLGVCGGTSSGSFAVSAGATLNFYGYQGPGPQVLTSSASLNGDGNVLVGYGTYGGHLMDNGVYNVTGSTSVGIPFQYWYGATMTLNGPVLNLGAMLTNNGNLFLNTNATCSGVFTFITSTLGGSGTLTVNGTMNWLGGVVTNTLIIASNATLNLIGDYPTNDDKGIVGTVNNFGTAIYTNTGRIAGNPTGVFNNKPSGVFDIQGDGGQIYSLYGQKPMAFNNAGLFRKSGGTNVTGVGNLAINNSGTMELFSGNLRLDNNCVITLLPTSTLHFYLGGEAPGSQFGRIVDYLGGGAFHLAGTLSVSLTNGFTPSPDDSFQILNWRSKTGGFTNTIPEGLDFGSVSNGFYFQGVADRLSGFSLVAKTRIVPVVPPVTNLLDLVIAVGDTAYFSPPPAIEPTYQWTHDSTNLPGQTGPSLILTNVQSSAAGTYCAIVADALSRTNTYCATLTVLSAQSLTTQPASQTVASGSDILLSVSATGGGAPLQYQWRLNGANIPDATSPTYSITNSQPSDGGVYDALVAMASQGKKIHTAVSTSAVVTVSSPALPFTDNFPGGSTNAANFVGSGNNFTATSQSSEPGHVGEPASHSVWLRWAMPTNGVARVSTRGSTFDTRLAVYMSTNGSPAFASLSLVAEDDDSGGFFTSEVLFNATAGTNYYIAVDGLGGARGQIVLSATLDTNITLIPRIIQNPLDLAVSSGATANFTVFASSTTNLSYQWSFGGWLAFPGATNAAFARTNVSYLDVGPYSVEVSSAGQSVESLPAALEIGDSHSLDKLEVLLREVSQSSGGGGGGFAFALKKKGGITPASFSFPSVSAGSLGSQLINNFNSTTELGEPIHSDTIGGSSRWFLLTAATNATMVIDTLGSDILTTLSVYVGSDIFSLTQVASDRNSAGDNAHSLVRFAAKSGTNYLIAVDGASGLQGNINLNWRMGTPPNVISTPQNRALAEKSTLVLSAGVSNNVTSPNYQWRVNGVNIAGATNATLSVSNLQFNQCGSYSVVVSNLVGAVTNAIATVSVQSPLRLGTEGEGFRVSGSATQTTVLELSTNLSLWTPLVTNTTPLLPVSFLDTSAAQRSKGFYQLKPWP